MTVGTYVLRRAAVIPVVLLGLLAIIFYVSRVMPGDPARLFLGPDATAAQVDALRHQWGLDQSIFIQFYVYLAGVLHGNLGLSLHYQQPVLVLIGAYFPATLELTTASMIIALVIGIPLGIVASTHRNRFLDNFSRVLSLVGVSMPEFWSGILLLLLFFSLVGQIPLGRFDSGAISPPAVTGLYTIDSIIAGNWNDLVITLRHLLPPAFILSLQSLAQITRMLRSRMIEISSQSYVTVAAANGMPKDLLTYKYMLKNAMTSTLSIVGLVYGFLLGGDFVVEAVFAWPGMGNAAVTALIYKDVNMVVGTTLFVGIGFFIINILVDVAYGVLDPRVRLS